MKVVLEHRGEEVVLILSVNVSVAADGRRDEDRVARVRHLLEQALIDRRDELPFALPVSRVSRHVDDDEVGVLEEAAQLALDRAGEAAADMLQLLKVEAGRGDGRGEEVVEPPPLGKADEEAGVQERPAETDMRRDALQTGKKVVHTGMKKKLFKSLFPKRGMAFLEAAEPSHQRQLKGLITKARDASKGDAGRVLIIGGSERYVGAAVLAGLAALRCGVDSVLIAAPETSARLMNAFSPDLITVKLPGGDLNDEHNATLEHLSETASVVLLGPGLGVSEQRRAWLEKLIPRLRAPLVLDADATKQVRLVQLERAILFANRREYEELKATNSFTDEHAAASIGSNVLVIKGAEDVLLTAEKQWVVAGGHSRATVSGTGDVLSGIAAAFLAQTKQERDAAFAACTVAKRAAERLGKRLGFSFLASDLVAELPAVLRELKLFRNA